MAQRMTPEQQQLAADNQRLVHMVLRKRFYAWIETYDELAGFGMLGLCKAAMTFRPEFGSTFATYASRCIYNEIAQHLRKLKNKSAESLDAVVQDRTGESHSYHEFIPDKAPRAPELMDKQETLHIAEELLGPILTRVVTGQLKQVDAARLLGISQSYVSRLIKQKLPLIREALE